MRGDSVGNVTAAEGRRLGGAVAGGADGVRALAGSSAIERLDAEVAAGAVPDEAARVAAARAEAAARRGAARRAELARAERALPGVVCAGGETAGGAAASAQDPHGRYAGAAAAAAAEQREADGEARGARAEGEARYAVERAAEAERAEAARRTAARGRAEAERRALPELHRATGGAGGQRLGAADDAAGGCAGVEAADEDPEEQVLLRDASGARGDVRLALARGEGVASARARAAAAVSAAEPSAPALCAADVRLVFAGPPHPPPPVLSGHAASLTPY